MIEISKVLGTIKGTFSDIKKKFWVSKNVTDLKIDKNEKEVLGTIRKMGDKNSIGYSSFTENARS